MTLLLIFFSGIVVENVILSKFLGLCSFFGLTNDKKASLGMSAAVIFVMTAATAVTYPLHALLLEPNGLSYLRVIVFVLVIASLVQLCEILLKKYAKPLHKALGVYLPLITTNCAVLGVAILAVDREYTFLQAIFYALGSGVGYLAAMVIFSGIRERIDEDCVAESFRGVPIMLVAAGILACAFVGFAGVVESIFS